MHNFNDFQIGQKVRRNNPGDYTHNREGEVIALNPEKSRVRVKWDIRNESGTFNFVRTWVTFKQLVIIK